jgi:hypothetical protein
VIGQVLKGDKEMARQPNILILMADQMAAPFLSLSGKGTQSGALGRRRRVVPISLLQQPAVWPFAVFDDDGAVALANWRL